MSQLLFGVRRGRHANNLLKISARSASKTSKPGTSRRLPGYFIALTSGFGAALIYRYAVPNNPAQGLTPVSFTPYELVSKQFVSSTSKIFLLWPLSLEGGHTVYDDAWRKGVWSVEFKQPQLQIARAYTPLPPPPNLTEAPETTSELRFLIRKDPEGEVSGYLHGLREGAILEARGPHIEYELPDEVENVLFLAGGTGIAPSLQAVHSLLEARRDGKRRCVHILWANRRREDCIGGKSQTVQVPPSNSWLSIFSRKELAPTVGQSPNQGLIVRELEQLKAKHPGQLIVDYFVDEEGTFIQRDAIHNSLRSFDSGKVVSDRTNNLLLISGPEGFVSYFAGPKAWKNGKEVQGELGGILSRTNLNGWKVRKL